MSAWNSLWAWNHISWSASKPTLSPLLIARQSDQSEQPSTRRSSEQPRSRPESSWSFFFFFLKLSPHDLVKTKLVLLHHHLTSSLLRPLDLLRRSLRHHQLLKLFLMSLYPSVSRLPSLLFLLACVCFTLLSCDISLYPFALHSLAGAKSPEQWCGWTPPGFPRASHILYS